ncbi:MAG: ribosomal L7Ae/L30e/S12e/Gadd45 family protein [Candidatus Parvarchaeota archaeon]|nr:ribosomal L7Ae/L30e/S12e/Gadd45 family protein [Candidatus Jingweiarchaeum tengchongense]MCW1298200.1 ribosomal L7Ae/L30e/S12e/Gadd45 family protein [Candidatus Jingweiarchaeum tengchongense]MCW1299998.1 ribosomal L7Ae/L30e/S12e/Gadd45 family protein [Candidatus Jingweiarchaeum tengchongense]MCW1305012.1 ribosomal L7Ae/L30e/S12e/Gadd45 family protein [Candidatus Jingweiarchaeum tengchongense]MCW1305453.1 ribosomal L7Ae/L30e/S12e/Gadd45 family protein [Candidatus Jingweiarchaeum tengchongense
MPISDEIKKALESKELIIGKEKSMEALKKGIVKKIIFANNCMQNVKDEIIDLARINNCEFEEFNGTNMELGILCKKPFSISVIAIIKGEKSEDKA